MAACCAPCTPFYQRMAARAPKRARSSGLGEIRPSCADEPDNPDCCTNDDTDVACDPHVFHGAGAGFDSASVVGASGGSVLGPVAGGVTPATPDAAQPSASPTLSSAGKKTGAASGVSIRKSACDQASRATMIGGALLGLVGGTIVGGLVGYFASR